MFNCLWPSGSPQGSCVALDDTLAPEPRLYSVYPPLPSQLTPQLVLFHFNFKHFGFLTIFTQRYFILYFSFEDINNDLSELPIKLFNNWEGELEETGQTECADSTAAFGGLSECANSTAAFGGLSLHLRESKNLVPVLKRAKYTFG